MKKILLLNQGKTNNLGDIAIYQTIKTYFENYNFEVDFYPFWDENIVFSPKYDKWPTIIKKVIWKSQLLPDFLNKRAFRKNVDLKKYDLVLIGGGELLSGHPGFNSSLFIISKICSKLSIPIYLLGVSGDANMSEYFLKRNRKALKNISKVFVRDLYTQKILKEIYDIDAIYSPDVVFAYHHVCKIKSKSAKKDYLTIVPIEFNYLIRKNLNLSSIAEYIDYLKKLTFQKLGSQKKVCIAITTVEDYGVAEKLYIILKKENISVKLYKYININDFEKILRKSRLVVSGRMHALILGILNNSLVDVIPFKEKLKVFGDNYSNREIITKTLLKQVIGTLDSIRDDLIRGDIHGQ